MSDETTPAVKRASLELFSDSGLHWSGRARDALTAALDIEEMAWALYEGTGSREDFARLSASYAPGSPIGKAFARARKVRTAILGSD